MVPDAVHIISRPWWERPPCRRPGPRAREVAEVAQKVAESDTVMQEISAVTAEYQPLANKCSNIYFTLDQLHVVQL